MGGDHDRDEVPAAPDVAARVEAGDGDDGDLHRRVRDERRLAEELPPRTDERCEEVGECGCSEQAGEDAQHDGEPSLGRREMFRGCPAHRVLLT
jgi:hypothetical protein